MSLIQTLNCDQCEDKIPAGDRAERGWHSIQLHDLTMGVQAQVDLCAPCFGSVHLTELVQGTVIRGLPT